MLETIHNRPEEICFWLGLRWQHRQLFIYQIPFQGGIRANGRVKDNIKALVGTTTKTKLPFTAVGRWWYEQLEAYMGGQIRTLVLFMINFRYLIDVKVELFSRLPDI
jgi:hypothetical protein